jgi:hypothetical protein
MVQESKNGSSGDGSPETPLELRYDRGGAFQRLRNSLWDSGRQRSGFCWRKQAKPRTWLSAVDGNTAGCLAPTAASSARFSLSQPWHAIRVNSQDAIAGEFSGAAYARGSETRPHSCSDLPRPDRKGGVVDAFLN